MLKYVELCWSRIFSNSILTRQAATVLASVAISVPGWASVSCRCVFRPMLRWVAAKTRLQPKRPWRWVMRSTSDIPSDSHVIPRLYTCISIVYLCLYTWLSCILYEIIYWWIHVYSSIRLNHPNQSHPRSIPAPRSWPMTPIEFINHSFWIISSDHSNLTYL